MSDAVSRAQEALRAVRARVGSPLLEPTVGSGPPPTEALDALAAELDAFWAAWEAAGEEDQATILDPDARAAVAGVARAAAAPFGIHRDGARFRGLLERARELDPSQAPLIDAASREEEVYLALAHAEWLAESGAVLRSQRVATEALERARGDAVRARLRRLASPPQPLKRAPALFTLNGVGVKLYGSRDESDDGWYTSTLYFVVLFVPILPIAAYRIQRHGDRVFFASKEPLSRAARIWQAVVGSLAVLGVAGGALFSWLGSDGRKLGKALAEAKALEDAGDRRGALEKYRALLDWKDADPKSPTDLGPVGEGIVRVLLAEVPRPCTATSPDAMRGVVAELLGLPVRARSRASSAHLAAALAACGREVSGVDGEGVGAKLALLSMANEVDAQAAAEAGAADDERRTRLALAERAREDRPRLAFEQLVRAKEWRPALALARAWKDEPGLLDESGHLVRLLVAGLGAEGAALGEALAVAEGRAKASRALIDKGVLADVEKASAEHPGDEFLVLALVAADREKGDAATALARIEKLGPPALTSAPAQVARASCLRELGRLDDAAKVLAELVAERILGFQEAQRRFGAALQAAQQRVDTVLASDHPPEDLVRKVESAGSEEQKRAAVNDWVLETLSADAAVVAARGEMERESGVVLASIELGSVEIARADKLLGKAREERLRSAERAFLSIANGAGGDPMFQLGLAQVYHRSGRVSEGDELFQKALASGDPHAGLEVIHAYRELGAEQKAQIAAERVYESKAPLPARQQAARARALLAYDLDERDAWLAKANQEDPQVRRSRDEVRALKLVRQGKDEEADRILARLADEEEKAAKTLASHANNAALFLGERYATTGDPAHLVRSQALLRSAARMAPDNAILAMNLAYTERHLGLARALETLVRGKDLRLLAHEADRAAERILAGPSRDKLLAALRAEPAWRQGVESLARYRTLAPGAEDAALETLEWLVETDDAKGIAELEANARAPDPADVARARAQRKATRADGSALRAVREQRAAVEARIARARKGGHGPTIALALYSAADLEYVIASLEEPPGGATKAVEHAREALALAPDLVGEGALGGALLYAALVATAHDGGAPGKAALTELVEDGYLCVLHRLVTAPDRAALLTALRGRAEVAEALKLLRSPRNSRFGFYSLLAGRVGPDADLEKLGRAGLASRPWMLQAQRVRARLGGPGSVGEKELAVLQELLK